MTSLRTEWSRWSFSFEHCFYKYPCLYKIDKHYSNDLLFYFLKLCLASFESDVTVLG